MEEGASTTAAREIQRKSRLHTERRPAVCRIGGSDRLVRRKFATPKNNENGPGYHGNCTVLREQKQRRGGSKILQVARLPGG